MVGRYPDSKFPDSEGDDVRTIDIFDGDTGQLMHQHFRRCTRNKIISLNLFSPNGDYLLSAGGKGCLLFVGCWVFITGSRSIKII